MRVIVVGGGIIGRSTAWRAARAGFDVTLLDPAPRTAAAWVAAGMLAPVAEAAYGEEVLLALMVASARRWPAFAAELRGDADVDPGLVACGTVLVARDADDLTALDRLHGFHRELGLDAERVSSRVLRRHEPALGPAIRGGLVLGADHQVDNRRLLAALATALDRRGVRIRSTRATAVTADGVELDDGTALSADAVVVAAGAWSGQLVTGVAVRPVKGQTIRLRTTARSVAPTRVVRGLGVYLAPRPGGEVVVGATMEEQGFDTSVTAGAVRELLQAAWELVPGVAEMTVQEVAAGLRPATTDNRPVIGAMTDGVIVATGHFRHGILLAPVTADAVVALLTDGVVPPQVAAVASPERVPA